MISAIAILLVASATGDVASASGGTAAKVSTGTVSAVTATGTSTANEKNADPKAVLENSLKTYFSENVKDKSGKLDVAKLGEFIKKIDSVQDSEMKSNAIGAVASIISGEMESAKKSAETAAKASVEKVPEETTKSPMEDPLFPVVAGIAVLALVAAGASVVAARKASVSAKASSATPAPVHAVGMDEIRVSVADALKSSKETSATVAEFKD